MHHHCTLSVQVLDELDIMLKVWKKRTEHVFTAHIQKGGEDRAAEDASGDDSSMRYSGDQRFQPSPSTFRGHCCFNHNLQYKATGFRVNLAIKVRYPSPQYAP